MNSAGGAGTPTPSGEPDGAEPRTRCGFVAILGAPNAGKSTLVNALTGAKISIVTPKVQTTRTRVIGVMMAGGSQVVLVDTPGIFEPSKRLDRAMVAAAWQSASDADLVGVLVDAERNRGRTDPETKRILDGLGSAKQGGLLLLNKIDQVRRTELLEIAARLNAEATFSDTFMISALKGDGVDDLRQYLAKTVPEGPFLYPTDQLSDMSDRLLAAEITREKLYLALYQELPYSLTVETDQWEEHKNGGVRIEQTIYVERDSQKAIVLGKRGEQIKKIGAASREELSELWDRPVHLFLFVKVRDKWQDDPARYRDWGLDFSA
ncbi:MAG: GTPase Era [Bauldia litoralis]